MNNVINTPYCSQFSTEIYRNNEFEKNNNFSESYTKLRIGKKILIINFFGRETIEEKKRTNKF